jgi:SNF2 family DNA or RNA helicase
MLAGVLREHFDVLITTYEMLTADGCEHFFKVAMTWEWVILDEGHRIRNPGTNLCQLVHKIESRGRLILSGTPLQVAPQRTNG